jgi:hypothetical protein
MTRMIIRPSSALLLVSLFCLFMPARPVARSAEKNLTVSASPGCQSPCEGRENENANAEETNNAARADTAAPQTSAVPAPQARQKQSVYFEPTYLNLLRAMIRFKGYDIGNDDLLDAYSLIEGCDLYAKFYKDDFAWKQIRAMYRKSLTQKMDLLPEYFSFVVPLLLDRYDFQTGIFRFAANSVMRNTHRLVLADHPSSTCATNWETMRRLPNQVSVDVSPFTIEGLKISPDQAESLVADMEREKSTERVVHARFHVHIVSAPVLQISDDPAKTAHYNFQGDLETISFFEDKDLQHPLWVYRPVYESPEQRAREMDDILNLKTPQKAIESQPAPTAPSPE